MPRANRFFLPGHVWHITHRCHQRQFLFKFSRDRTSYLRWLFEARKRFGVCVLNYVVTSNHVHLLVREKGEGEIAQSMQLIAGAFPFNKYGIAKGVVEYLSPDAAELPDTRERDRRDTREHVMPPSGFLTLVKLETPHLDRDGKQFRLTAGMQVSA
jgi:Transposase IS200 like